MQDKIKQVKEKTSGFFQKSLKFCGKEIALNSNQHFDIWQIRNDENLQQGIYDYQIQYGFPQSGCIILDFSYGLENKNFSINEITVYAPDSSENIISANFAPQANNDNLTVSANFGLDMEAKEYIGASEIAQNPNALNLLNFANNDLENAEVLGECRLGVVMGGKRIPVCQSVKKSLNNGKNK